MPGEEDDGCCPEMSGDEMSGDEMSGLLMVWATGNRVIVPSSETMAEYCVPSAVQVRAA